MMDNKFTFAAPFLKSNTTLVILYLLCIVFNGSHASLESKPTNNESSTAEPLPNITTFQLQEPNISANESNNHTLLKSIIYHTTDSGHDDRNSANSTQQRNFTMPMTTTFANFTSSGYKLTEYRRPPVRTHGPRQQTPVTTMEPTLYYSIQKAEQNNNTHVNSSLALNHKEEDSLLQPTEPGNNLGGKTKQTTIHHSNNTTHSRQNVTVLKDKTTLYYNIKGKPNNSKDVRKQPPIEQSQDNNINMSKTISSSQIFDSQEGTKRASSKSNSSDHENYQKGVESHLVVNSPSPLPQQAVETTGETSQQAKERIRFGDFPLFNTQGNWVKNLTLLRVHWHLLHMMKQSCDQLIPPLVQLGYHNCMGGCNGCIDLRIKDNKGLTGVYKMLLAYHQEVSDVLSFADMVTLAAVNAANVGIIKAGGKRLITFQIGRKTCENPAEAEKLVEFPKGSDPLALDELMREFNLTRAEAIALIGAHSLGRCSKDHLGFQGPWDNTPLVLDNAYYASVLGYMKAVKTPDGKSHQWISERASRPSDFTRMMLSAEMIIVSNFTVSGREDSPSCSLSRCPRDEDCTDTLCPESQDKKVAKRYRNDENEFHKDFVRAFSKMIGRTSEVLSDPL